MVFPEVFWRCHSLFLLFFGSCSIIWQLCAKFTVIIVCLYAVQLTPVHRVLVPSHRCLSTTGTSTPAGGMSVCLSVWLVVCCFIIVSVQWFTNYACHGLYKPGRDYSCHLLFMLVYVCLSFCLSAFVWWSVCFPAFIFCLFVCLYFYTCIVVKNWSLGSIFLFFVFCIGFFFVKFPVYVFMCALIRKFVPAMTCHVLIGRLNFCFFTLVCL